MVTVPVRSPPVLAATIRPTVPLPLPLAPLVTVIQDALLDAVQLQPPGASTPTVAGPPGALTFCSGWLSSYVQFTEAAACVTA